MKMAAEPIMGTERQNNYRAHHEILRGFSNAHGESAYPIVNLARIGPTITEN